MKPMEEQHSGNWDVAVAGHHVSSMCGTLGSIPQNKTRDFRPYRDTVPRKGAWTMKGYEASSGAQAEPYTPSLC